MGKKRPTNLSINEALIDKAKDLMADRNFDSLTAFIEQLIRDEYDRRKPEAMHDAPPPPPPPPGSAKTKPKP